jgi:hypothetical protein
MRCFSKISKDIVNISHDSSTNTGTFLGGAAGAALVATSAFLIPEVLSFMLFVGVYAGFENEVKISADYNDAGNYQINVAVEPYSFLDTVVCGTLALPAGVATIGAVVGQVAYEKLEDILVSTSFDGPTVFHGNEL